MNIPDLAAVLGDGSITAEFARVGDTNDSHLSPFFVVSVCVISFVLSIDVRVEIEACDVVVTAVAKGIDDRVHD